MNELATVSSVKSLSDADRAKHLKAIDEQRKAIDRHQRGIREHLKAMLDVPDDEDEDRDTYPADTHDPSSDFDWQTNFATVRPAPTSFDL
jgi:hypothetical protein